MAHPATGNATAGYGTHMPSFYHADPRNPGLRADPATGEITTRRFDPDAARHPADPASKPEPPCSPPDRRAQDPAGQDVEPASSCCLPLGLCLAGGCR